MPHHPDLNAHMTIWATARANLNVPRSYARVCGNVAQTIRKCTVSNTGFT
jgi:hypothetical protein